MIKAGTFGCVSIDSETQESGVINCTTIDIVCPLTLTHNRLVSTNFTPGFVCRAFSDTTLVCYSVNVHIQPSVPALTINKTLCCHVIAHWYETQLRTHCNPTWWFLAIDGILMKSHWIFPRSCSTNLRTNQSASFMCNIINILHGCPKRPFHHSGLKLFYTLFHAVSHKVVVCQKIWIW